MWQVLILDVVDMMDAYARLKFVAIVLGLSSLG